LGPAFYLYCKLSGLRDNNVLYYSMAIANPYLYFTERSTELFFIFDLESDIFTYMNPTCMAFFGIDSIQSTSAFFFDMVHADDQRHVLSKLNTCIAGGTVINLEFKMQQGNHVRWLRINPLLANEEGERLIMGQAEDITDYKATLEVLNNHNSKKNSILNILVHDLAGPIGAIGNLATLLEKEIKLLNNSSVDRYVNVINRITESCIKLIREFVNQEFLESAKVEMIKSRVDLVSKISIATQNYFDMQESLRVEFSCHSNRKIVFAEIDEDKFMQVISNLISNALKFTPEGGKIDIYIEQSKKEVLISVADTGIGIPKRFHGALFEKFTEARRTGLNGERSTGLGMSIVKTIVEWHDGKIWFESEEGKGTTFFIQLPRIR
jgi:two-component system sensor histidine kinase VicK